MGPEAEALPEGQWPLEPHPPMSTQALKEGQVQLLVKKDPGAVRPTGIAADADCPASMPDRPNGDTEGRSDGTALAVSCSHDGVLPPGTELPGGNGAGVILTCSDKIALWSALGVQASGDSGKRWGISYHS